MSCNGYRRTTLIIPEFHERTIAPFSTTETATAILELATSQYNLHKHSSGEKENQLYV
jgi:hypothetical protein